MSNELNEAGSIGSACPVGKRLDSTSRFNNGSDAVSSASSSCCCSAFGDAVVFASVACPMAEIENARDRNHPNFSPTVLAKLVGELDAGC